MAFLGWDIGSVSVKIARISADGSVVDYTYHRHYGKPMETAVKLLQQAIAEHPDLHNIGFTGSGGKLIADWLGAPFENEIITSAKAAAHLTPDVHTLIEIGGEDSRLIVLERDAQGNIRDFAMNGLCAAGCGSFLDQQAARLGLQIEGEFGKLALQSKKPARVAGRCSVFAKTDMIHLQQQATPVSDIVAGLCYAFARNFVSVVARGKDIVPPVAFHGGVAFNAGMVKAFQALLGLQDGDFLVPKHAATAGAIGAALLACSSALQASLDLARIGLFLVQPIGDIDAHDPLPHPGAPPASRLADVPPGTRVDAYLGIDIGSISTNVVLIDEDKRVLAKSYLMTAGRPIEAVRKGLEEVGANWQERVNVKGVCTTGSGRYLIGDVVGADVVKNEITAQARAAVEIDPEVDTIFEIGGQDSKYISIDQGAIVDFEMNKVCAAGTGSFLEEQAGRLGISIKGEFADAALSSPSPVRLGERCTVFMESDLVGHQARGSSTADLAAGLAYATVHNYLNRVVGERKIGERIFFQGGTAFNRAVVSAFRQVTGKQVVVPEHHEVTGALGCALIARENANAVSKFKGWDLSSRKYAQDSFECRSCANSCEINRVKVQGQETLFYGGRCEKYEKRNEALTPIPDLFAERERLLLLGYEEGEKLPGKPLIGIPRTLHFAEYLPFWTAFFRELGLPVKLSQPTNKHLTERGTEATLAEFCFPVKVAHGHALDLMDAGVTHLFVPNIQQLPKMHADYKESVSCPYVQSLAYSLKAALQPESQGVALFAPVVDLSGETPAIATALYQQFKTLGVSKAKVAKALAAGHAAQREFGKAMQTIGKRTLEELPQDGRAIVIVSRPYNGCDNGINLELPRRFRELGVLPIPLDMLPVDDIDLSEEFPDLTWRYGQKILAGADIIRRDPRLAAAYLTNFGCGPDSFLLKFFRSRMGGKVSLTLEIDEHSSDVGVITRCEAFLDSLKKLPKEAAVEKPFRVHHFSKTARRTLYIPYMSDLAHTFAAAFRAEGVPAEVLPETDAEAVAMAKRYVTGKECFPCIVTTGDMLKQLAVPGFNPSAAAFFMPSAGGGCRFGYYNHLQRMVLDELGYHDVPFFSPNQNDGLYASLGMTVSDRFVRRAWQGLIATELLTKALHWVRPREVTPGTAYAVYQAQLTRLISATETGSSIQPLMHEARADFAAVPVREAEYPWVGILGEVFVRLHRYSNQHLIENLERLGAHAWMVPFSEWIFYVNMLEKEDNRKQRRWSDLFRTFAVDRIMVRDEHQLSSPWVGFLPNVHETSPHATITHGRRYVDPAFRGDAVLSLGKAVDFHHHGIAGLINVMPFTCMPGTITGGILKRFQQEHDGIPTLTLSYDGQSDANMPIRLEAFVQQCRGYQARRKQ